MAVTTPSPLLPPTTQVPAGYVVKGGAGADSISIASGTFSAGEMTVYGGAGNDSIDITGGKAAELKTQGGADVVSADGSTITTLHCW